MILLGSDRAITQEFKGDTKGEDYSGEHLSPIKIVGAARVLQVVNHYLPHEDTINYYTFLENRNLFRKEDGYHCISITGKEVLYQEDTLSGNKILLEGSISGKKYYYLLTHLASVSVKVGDLIDSNTILGYQGNTGLVLSDKPYTDPTYGTHVHFEVFDENGTATSPRDYASGGIMIHYREEKKIIDAGVFHIVRSFEQ